MNKQLLLAILLVLSVLFSVSAVCASEVSVTDSYAASLVDDTSDVSVYNYAAGSDISVSGDSNVDNDSSKVSLSSEEVLESEDSNVLNSNDKRDVYFVAPNRTLLIDEIIDGYSYPVVLKDENGGIANAKVTLVFNGQKYVETTDGYGQAYFNISVDKTGKYKVTLKFAGDANYNSLSRYSIATVNVKGMGVTFVAPNRTLLVDEISGGYRYPIILKDENGVGIANKNVTLIFNGQKYVETTNNRGWAYYNISVDKTGNYKITLKFASDGYYDSLSKYGFTAVKVIGHDVSFVAFNMTLLVDEISGGYSYPVVLKDENGNGIANKNVTLIFNGQKYVETTNAKGWAYFNISVSKIGNYKITLKFGSDGYYNSLSKYGFTAVKVLGHNVTFVAPNRTLLVDEISGGYRYPIILKDENGNGIANKNVTLIFNGQKYVETTNNRGWAYYNISVDKTGNYKITLKFGSDGYYNSLSKYGFTVVEVITMKDVCFVASNKTLLLNEISGGYSYQVTLKDVKGNTLANKKITLTFNGQSYVQTTNSDGQAYFNIVANKVGLYSISLNFLGDKYYNPMSSSNFSVTVLRYDTRVTWNGGTYFKSGYETFKVLLTDANGFALVDKDVKLTINSDVYSVKTDANGFATFSLNLGPTIYIASYAFEGDEEYSPSSGSIEITLINSNSYGYGYFLFGRDMKSVNLNSLANEGTTDLFLNYYAIELYGKSDVESWIASANRLGIRVHIWMQVFYEGYWVNPVSNGVQNTQFFNSKIEEVREYANIKGVSGILFDYLRYPGTAYKTNGGTAAITQFTRLATTEIHRINPLIMVSAALMPETTNNIYYYGQDYSALSSCLDAVLPMVYKGNYKSGSSWISSVTKWYVDNSKGAKVWVTLQAYKSDDDTTRLSISELNNDIRTTLNARSSGVILFRYGLTNFPNFNNFK